MKQVVIGLLGTVLDRGTAQDRWDHWRPSVSVCQHEDLLIDRYELLFEKEHEKLARTVMADIWQVSPETTVIPHPISWKNPWDFEEVYGALLDFARKYPFDPEKEEYLVHITTGTHVAQICEFILTESRYFPAKLIQTAPPKREQPGHPGRYQIIDLDLSKYDRIATRFQQEISDDISFLKSGIQTRNKRFNALIERIEHVALRTTHPILLTGPTGAGKSRLARQIFELKKTRRRLSGSFVEINCATLRGDTAMSILFGHKKGAFTGASEARDGLLRSAHGGLLFLDEIGELGLDEQAMLLRAVEEKKFLPLGSDREQSSDFQLICGSNRDLPAAVAEGRFREDLLARINLWTFDLPGLKDRPEDIEPNIQFELTRYEMTTGNPVRFNKEAKDRFLSFATSGPAIWKGNFRDLIGSVTRMATLAPGGRISIPIVNDEISRLTQSWQEHSSDPDREYLTRILGREKVDSLDEFERPQLAGVLRICRKSKSLSEAGRQLFAVSRQKRTCANDADRLRKYLARFAIAWTDLHESIGIEPLA
jgi:transcriptional regulatory protein RtcR